MLLYIQFVSILFYDRDRENLYFKLNYGYKFRTQ